MSKIRIVHQVQQVVFWVSLRKDMENRLRRKTMEAKKVHALSTEVKLVVDRKFDKWSVSSAFERVKCDLKVQIIDTDGSKAACSGSTG